MSRIPWLFGVVVAPLAVAGLLLWWCWAQGVCAFLVVDEANGLPPAAWSGGEVSSLAWFDGEGNPHLPRGSVRPWHRVVCLHEVDAAGVRVASRVLAGGRFPARISLNDPVAGMDSSRRVLAGPLLVLGMAPNRELRLRYGGQEVTLAPGQSWAELRVRGEPGERVFSPAAPVAWQEGVEEALARGEPVTRLVITFHGAWPRSRLTALTRRSPGEDSRACGGETVGALEDAVPGSRGHGRACSVPAGRWSPCRVGCAPSW